MNYFDRPVNFFDQVKPDLSRCLTEEFRSRFFCRSGTNKVDFLFHRFKVEGFTTDKMKRAVCYKWQSSLLSQRDMVA